MITYFKTDEQGILQKIPSPERGCWISAVSPSPSEQEYLMNTIGIVPEFIKASLDEEESSYIDQDEEENQILIIADYPEKDRSNTRNTDTFITLPIGIVLLKGYIVTICSQKNSTVSSLESGKIKELDTRYKTRFLLQTLFLISQEFLLFLRQIEKLSSQVEQRLYKSMKNRELAHMLDLDKSLIYFSTSLKGDELTLNKIMRSPLIPLYEEDEDLLEDVMIEIRQAIEMCDIYMSINARTSDGFSNVINNNLNVVMKQLTVITIIMSIPNMIYGFYGMNVEGLALPHAWFPLVLSIILCIVAWIYFERTDRFR